MTMDTLTDIYNQLYALNERGDEAGALKLLQERFNELPEDVQGTLLARSYFETLPQQIQDEETVMRTQEKGIKLYDALQKLKEKIQPKG